MMTIGDHEGRIYLSLPNTHDRFLYYDMEALLLNLNTGVKHKICDVIISTLWLRLYLSMSPPRDYTFLQLCVYLRGKQNMISA